MGTHPIFESDFDCLTDSFFIRLFFVATRSPERRAKEKKSYKQLFSRKSIRFYFILPRSDFNNFTIPSLIPGHVFRISSLSLSGTSSNLTSIDALFQQKKFGEAPPW